MISSLKNLSDALDRAIGKNPEVERLVWKCKRWHVRLRLWWQGYAVIKSDGIRYRVSVKETK